MNKLLIFAGAGLSAESGITTFRDQNGLWSQYDMHKVCNYFSFRENKLNLSYRENLFEFYNELKRQMNQVEANSAHMQIAEWQKELGNDRVKIVTSNLDLLLEKAGCSNVLHVHGSIDKMHCIACQHQWYASEIFEDQRCGRCESRLTKPLVYFFGEKVPEYVKLKAMYHPKRINKDDVILWIGSSMEVISPSWLFRRNNKIIQAEKILVNLTTNEQDILFNKKL